MFCERSTAGVHMDTPRQDGSEWMCDTNSVCRSMRSFRAVARHDWAPTPQATRRFVRRRGEVFPCVLDRSKASENPSCEFRASCAWLLATPDELIFSSCRKQHPLSTGFGASRPRCTGCQISLGLGTHFQLPSGTPGGEATCPPAWFVHVEAETFSAQQGWNDRLQCAEQQEMPTLLDVMRDKKTNVVMALPMKRKDLAHGDRHDWASLCTVAPFTQIC